MTRWCTTGPLASAACGNATTDAVRVVAATRNHWVQRAILRLLGPADRRAPCPAPATREECKPRTSAFVARDAWISATPRRIGDGTNRRRPFAGTPLHAERTPMHATSRVKNRL